MYPENKSWMRIWNELKCWIPVYRTDPGQKFIKEIQQLIPDLLPRVYTFRIPVHFYIDFGTKGRFYITIKALYRLDRDWVQFQRAPRNITFHKLCVRVA
jgi:hypothetical protein